MVSFCFYFNNPIWHWAPTNIPNLLYATFACLSFVFSRVVEIFCQSVFILVYWDYNLTSKFKVFVSFASLWSSRYLFRLLLCEVWSKMSRTSCAVFGGQKYRSALYSVCLLFHVQWPHLRLILYVSLRMRQLFQPCNHISPLINHSSSESITRNLTIRLYCLLLRMLRWCRLRHCFVVNTSGCIILVFSPLQFFKHLCLTTIFHLYQP